MGRLFKLSKAAARHISTSAIIANEYFYNYIFIYMVRWFPRITLYIIAKLQDVFGSRRCDYSGLYCIIYKGQYANIKEIALNQTRNFHNEYEIFLRIYDNYTIDLLRDYINSVTGTNSSFTKNVKYNYMIAFSDNPNTHIKSVEIDLRYSRYINPLSHDYIPYGILELVQIQS